MVDFNATEQRAIIKMCVTLGESPVDTMKILSDATGKPPVCQTLVLQVYIFVYADSFHPGWCVIWHLLVSLTFVC